MLAIQKDVRTTFSCEKDLMNAVDQFAANNEMDRSKVIRLAIKKFLNVSPIEKRSAKK
ncbi:MULTISPECIES: ribbon-helix-helix protein, CopG family [Leptospira]|nr:MULTISPECIES: ribbon-helix-helix protein, CopG family [Leptospira]MCG6144100.1 ribbon-helix-helix protein, CopG family [Leptospira bandrabouensis]MCG6159761.1 ribbon-helix-helix protein, CopG family [Leptospira bandrabouensis]MCG6163694.1 ribbon-helix-helix protein, CopG family [Leptospira bandrabouensis]